MSKLVPLGDRLIVKRALAKETTESGIVLPDSARKTSLECEVVAVGVGRITTEGRRIPLEVQVADTVIVEPRSGAEIEVDGEKYLIINEDQVLSIIRD